MSDTQPFAEAVLVFAAVGIAAVLSHRLTERFKVPAAALLLVASAIAVKAIPSLHAPSERTVERLVTLALLVILFDGGMHIGWRRFRGSASPIAVVGVAGTFLTVAGGAVLARYAFDLPRYAAVLLATAVAPTDPAVVFSVLGRREIAGRAGTILEGESGANDPVGIALMASLISAGSLSGGTALHVAGEFILQMGVGAAIGVAGGWALLAFMRKVPLPSEALYPIRTLMCVLALFGLATVARGSGFLAVFVAGILIGDRKAPYKREIERFHSALASLGEIVAFVALGLTVDLSVLSRANVWVPGLVLGIALALVIRPVLVGLCLIPARLPRNELGFVVLAGLKGAVPILLGVSLLSAHIAGATRLYGIVVVVVVFSVVVQGSLVPFLAGAFRLPMRSSELEPWTLGVRLRHEPEGVHRLVVASGSAVIGHLVAELPGEVWVSSVVRDGHLVRVHEGTRLRAGDEVIVFADPEQSEQLRHDFESAQAEGPEIS
ncbi:MAG TPA: cation:proton antiporter [Frankiaceae bacterium]|nr:cation:proton antiporter [Frankiaceae bacterium]